MTEDKVVVDNGGQIIFNRGSVQSDNQDIKSGPSPSETQVLSTHELKVGQTLDFSALRSEGPIPIIIGRSPNSILNNKGEPVREMAAKERHVLLKDEQGQPSGKGVHRSIVRIIPLRNGGINVTNLTQEPLFVGDGSYMHPLQPNMPIYVARDDPQRTNVEKFSIKLNSDYILTTVSAGDGPNSFKFEKVNQE